MEFRDLPSYTLCFLKLYFLDFLHQILDSLISLSLVLAYTIIFVAFQQPQS